MRERLGIFGGTFNPVHLGHVAVAEAAARAFRLARVLVVPAHVSPFRTAEAAPAPDAARLAMVRLACADHPVLEPSDAEIRRGGVSYAVDTVRTVAAAHPGAEIFFILGMDSLSGLARWHEAAALCRLCSFIVLARPGVPRVPPPPGARVEYLEGDPHDVSSTDIRRRLAAGESVDGLVAPAVAAYIRENLLYLKQRPTGEVIP